MGGGRFVADGSVAAGRRLQSTKSRIDSATRSWALGTGALSRVPWETTGRLLVVAAAVLAGVLFVMVGTETLVGLPFAAFAVGRGGPAPARCPHPSYAEGPGAVVTGRRLRPSAVDPSAEDRSRVVPGHSDVGVARWRAHVVLRLRGVPGILDQCLRGHASSSGGGGGGGSGGGGGGSW